MAVPIAAGDLDEARRQINAAKAAGAEMLELRTDYLENLTVDLVRGLVAEVKAARLPVIVTCRDRRQGGAIDYPVQLRVDILAAALLAGAKFADFEYENFLAPENREKITRALSQSLKGKLILSAHNFRGRFDDILKLYRHILTLYPAAIPKLVYTANHINDCFEAFDLLRTTSGERIVFCMGQAGLISRIITKKLGGLVTFASVDDRTATAPGQLTIGQLRELYRHNDIKPDTELFGVIGNPIAHSLSPAVHNACFADTKLNKLYLPLLVEGGKEEFDSFLNNILARNWLAFRGISVTIPHKENALNYVKAKQGFIEPLADKIGAANTIIISKDGRLKAYNTDCAGALDAITAALNVSEAGLNNLSVAIIGAGGVARAIVAGLGDAGAKITIYNRTVKRGEDLAAEFGCRFAPLNELKNVDAKLLINCTNIGMHPNIDETPIPQQYLKKDMAVFDTVYNPAETLLLKQAKETGAKTIDGLSMFINQAAAQFKLFTGKNPDTALMRKIVCDGLA